MTSYRFVHEYHSHPNNFLPTFFINPKRVNESRDLTSKCEGFGLSLFQVAEGAKAKFAEMMVKTNGKFAKLVGTHLAAIELKQEDGVGGNSNKSSHFTFHEYENVDLTNNIIHTEKL